MTKTLAILAALALSGSLSAIEPERICGIVRVTIPPLYAWVMPTYRMEVPILEIPEPSFFRTYELTGNHNSVLRDLMDGQWYCLRGFFIRNDESYHNYFDVVEIEKSLSLDDLDDM